LPQTATVPVSRDEMLAKIRSNIERFGHHIYVVAGKQSPRFAYTIGVSATKGAELILAGAAIYYKEDVLDILNTLPSMTTPGLVDGASMEVGSLGRFSLRKVDPSWAGELILGALDY
jgi:hypothetical protein